MSAPTTWGLIGHGNIGKEIERQIGQPAVAKRLNLEPKPNFIADAMGVSQGGKLNPSITFLDIDVLPDVVFVAMPSSNDGKVAYKYISKILDQGKLAITAEKGALANFFPELKISSADFKRLGVTATVGGGTRVLHIAKEYCQDTDNITQIHLVLNGTLAAIMGWVAPISGDVLTLSKAAKKAVEMGYAEPGSESAESIIRAEAEGDIPKKLSIFCNAVGLSPRLVDWNELRFSLSNEQINEAISSSSQRRFIVSIYPASSTSSAENDIIGGFNINHDKLVLVGGFRRIEANPLFGALTTLTGPGNGMVIGLGPEVSDGIYAITGPGAGVGPTVNTMIDDYIRLARNGEIK